MSGESPDPLAALDQTLRACLDAAKIVRTYYEALIAEGFEPSQALELTVAYQSSMWESDDE